ncbi:Redoxin [Geopyxis carbonaria]|nr:Redoxin [Geopyxis carbonaria]
MAISKGSKLPAAPKSLWEEAPDKPITFSSGKILIVGVPGAYTPPCSSHVPGYVEKYSEFEAKGYKDIYVIAVNDIFVVQAWKEHLAKGSKVHFVSDSTGEFTKAMGLDFDAAGLLGNVRSQRYAAVVEDGTVQELYVEDEAPNLTVSTADAVLKTL